MTKGTCFSTTWRISFFCQMQLPRLDGKPIVPEEVSVTLQESSSNSQRAGPKNHWLFQKFQILMMPLHTLISWLFWLHMIWRRDVRSQMIQKIVKALQMYNLGMLVPKMWCLKCRSSSNRFTFPRFQVYFSPFSSFCHSFWGKDHTLISVCWSSSSSLLLQNT